jgi:hypothetical protein
MQRRPKFEFHLSFIYHKFLWFHGAESFLSIWECTRLITEFSAFHGPRKFITGLQETTPISYPKPHEYNAHPPISLLKVRFSITLDSTPMSSK